MAILTNSGRSVIANILKSVTFYLAWGEGDTAWDTDFKQPSSTDTALIREIGRRAASLVEFCRPDVNGKIEVPSGKYSSSETSTLFIHLRFNFTLADSPTSTIRECGVFVGTQIHEEVLRETEYFMPEDIKTPGDLIFVERFVALNLATDFRRSFDFVIAL